MPEIRGFRRSLLVLGLVLWIGAIGCENDPQIHPSDAPATAGQMQFELKDYQLRYLELTDDAGQTVEYPDPVLAVQLEITNVGEDEFRYDPPHDARELTESRHLMLYEAPDQTEDVDWERFSPTPISGVELDEGDWDRQVQQSRSLAPGDSTEDYFLFEPPGVDDQSLLVSIPPAMHRGELPTFIQFDYSRPEPEGRTVYEIGDPIEFDGLTFEVTEIAQEYIELMEGDEEGYSNEPVLKISYILANDSDESVRFNPYHDDVTGNEGPVVQSGELDFARIRFPGDTDPVGQQGTVEIEPGDSIEDFAMFERPADSTDMATFVVPADYFDRSGTVRVNFSYEPEEVEQPEELQED